MTRKTAPAWADAIDHNGHNIVWLERHDGTARIVLEIVGEDDPGSSAADRAACPSGPHDDGGTEYGMVWDRQERNPDGAWVSREHGWCQGLWYDDGDARCDAWRALAPLLDRFGWTEADILED